MPSVAVAIIARIKILTSRVHLVKIFPVLNFLLRTAIHLTDYNIDIFKARERLLPKKPAELCSIDEIRRSSSVESEWLLVRPAAILPATVDPTAISNFWDQATIELATIDTVSIASVNIGRKGTSPPWHWLLTATPLVGA
jgi:hypothetical protein